eukprot:11595079-Heterocapsa_arctica.AAC.1
MPTTPRFKRTWCRGKCMRSYIPPADPDAVQHEIGDGDGDEEGDPDLDYEQQMFAENDDPPPLDDNPAAQEM